MRVKSFIKVYEIDGEKIPCGSDYPELEVKSHSTDRDKVILRFNGENIAIYGDELINAVEAVRKAKL